MNRTIQEWAAQKGTPHWQLAMVRTRFPAEGQLVSEAEFDAAVDELSKLPVGGGRTVAQKHHRAPAPIFLPRMNSKIRLSRRAK